MQPVPRETVLRIAAEVTGGMIANLKEYHSGYTCLLQAGGDVTLAEEAMALACKLVGNHFGHGRRDWDTSYARAWVGLYRAARGTF